MGPYIADFVCLEKRLIVSPLLSPPPQGGRRKKAPNNAWNVNFNDGHVNVYTFRALWRPVARAYDTRPERTDIDNMTLASDCHCEHPKGLS
jgi:hypothetical protein